jgi:HD-like signal output (HDOD) protein/CheY-like chemotaxis protein
LLLSVSDVEVCQPAVDKYLDRIVPEMKRILFVDDEPHLLDALRRMLRPQRNEWQMSFAGNGREALDLLAAQPFDVLVTDMRMPEMDGAELLEAVQKLHPGVVRIVLSGHVELEAAMRAASVAHQFLSKPCDPAELCSAVQQACQCRGRLERDDIRGIIGAIGQLPALPVTGARLMAALEDPEVDVARIEQIVGRDVGIAAKVLQFANSAFFGFRHRVTALRTAINLLGFDTLRQLVLTAEILRTFQPPARVYALWLSEVEAHSRLTAQIVAHLPLPARLVPTAVMAGLLHDTGKLVIATRFPAEFESTLQTSLRDHLPVHPLETRLLGVDHAQVGAYLLELWGLPEEIVEAARLHHQPMAAPLPAAETSVLSIVHIADALAHEFHDAQPPQAATPSPLLDLDYLHAIGAAGQLDQWRALAREAVATEAPDRDCAPVQ